MTERYLFGPGVVDGAVVDQILARTNASGTTAWYLNNKLGSVRDIVSTTGSNLDHIVYDSFGNIVSETNAANGDRFKFAGMEYDSTTAQYYDRARIYDAAVGTFAGADPVAFAAPGFNLFVYALNDPTDVTDPNGDNPVQRPLPTAAQVASFQAIKQQMIVAGRARMVLIGLRQDLAFLFDDLVVKRAALSSAIRMGGSKTAISAITAGIADDLLDFRNTTAMLAVQAAVSAQQDAILTRLINSSPLPAFIKQMYMKLYFGP
jgi:RHS repeat-associated protein